MTKATILIPTHAERPTLDFALRSALQQSVEDLEVFVIGDGCPDSTRRIVARHAEHDRRVRFFDFPKGERNGEAHRDTALQKGTAPVVTYLSDDDLLFPDAVEVAITCLADANFMAPRPCFVMGDGTPKLYDGDITSAYWRDLLLSVRRNFIPMSGVSHRMDFYRSLEQRWSPAPPDIWCDLYMWRKFMRHADFKGVMAPHPTAMIFPAPFRTKMTIDERAAEVRAWFDKLTDPQVRLALERRVLAERADAASLHLANHERAEVQLHASKERVAALERELAAVTVQAAREKEGAREALRTAREHAAQLDACRIEQEQALFETRRAHEQAVQSGARLKDELSLLRSSLTWRVRTRLYNQGWVRKPFLLSKTLFKR